MRRAGALLALFAAARAAPLGDLVSLTCANATCALIAANPGGAPATVPLRLAFFGPSVVRWWLAVDGNFSDTGAASDVIVAAPAPVALAQRDAGAYFEVTAAAAPGVAVRLQKAPLLLSIYVGGALVVQEAAPLAFNATHSWQTLARDAAPFAAGLAAEYFFGGGMQNGRFSHRDERLEIAVGYDWDDGGHPNPVPFFISSAGFAVLRNTWAAGEYTFTTPVVTAHAEPTRLDAFILLAGSGGIKALLGLYTNLTGPPFMPPMYALGLGDSDCCAFNAHHAAPARCAHSCDPSDPNSRLCARPTTLNQQTTTRVTATPRKWPSPSQSSTASTTCPAGGCCPTTGTGAVMGRAPPSFRRISPT